MATRNEDEPDPCEVKLNKGIKEVVMDGDGSIEDWADGCMLRLVPIFAIIWGIGWVLKKLFGVDPFSIWN